MENAPYDPYATPMTNVQPSGYSGNAGVSQGVIQQLAGTKGWVRFISVLMFIGAGLMLLIALLMAAMGSAMASATKNPMFAGGMGIFLAAIYGAFAFLYIFPALKLWKYATCIGNLISTNSITDLESALNEQRSFWKFIGIMTLLVLIPFAVMAIIALIGMVSAAMVAAKSQGA